MQETTNNDIMFALKEIKTVADGINKRLDNLNGSVAKHENRLNNQEVLNAQMTITQAQIVDDIKYIKSKEIEISDFKLRSEGSLNTFKWLFGFVGIGTILTLLRVLGFIR